MSNDNFKLKKCIECKVKFKQYKSTVKVCSWQCAMANAKKTRIKNDKKELKILRDSLKTNSDHRKELQILVNKFIRLRDKDKNCISCLKPLKSKYDAGHYRSVGSSPELRFEELNIHAQCVHCNQYLHGNLINYRVNLIKRIGLKKVKWLEKKHDSKNYSIPELKEMKLKYKNKIKILSK